MSVNMDDDSEAVDALPMKEVRNGAAETKEEEVVEAAAAEATERDVEGRDHEEGSSGEQVEEAEGQEEEEGECGFCLFMKSGPCRESFIQWEECVEQAEKANEDIVEKCHQVTFMLKECMEHNKDYYEPVLQAEKAMDEDALQGGEVEKEATAMAAAAKDDSSQSPDLMEASQPERQDQSEPSDSHVPLEAPASAECPTE